MNPYVGKVCPYCKGEIKENDEVVVCSKCEMPHHKECWIENEGCTTFGCDGTIQSAPQVASEIFNNHASNDFDIDVYGDSSDFVASYCPKCGSARNQNDRFCGHCGYDYSQIKDSATVKSEPSERKVAQDNPTYMTPVSKTVYYAESTSTVSADMPLQNSTGYEEGPHSFEQYVDKNTDYYSSKKIALSQGSKTGFNWSAFFFDGLWLAYRKMYGAAVLIAIIGSIAGLFTWGRLITFCVKLYIGFNGSSMYINKISEWQTEEGRLQGNVKDQFFNKHKGTTILGPILLLIGVYVAAFVIYYMLL